MRSAERAPAEERAATEDRVRNPLTALFVAPVFRRIGFMTNPPADFRLEPSDDTVVVAASLGELRPLVLQQA